YLGTAGYYNPFSSEAQVNTFLPSYVQGFISLHEMAHQAGAAAEDDASFIAYVKGIHSSDKLLRYSSYYHTSQSFMFELWLQDSISHTNLSQRISPLVKEDLLREREFWKQYSGSANRMSSIF